MECIIYPIIIVSNFHKNMPKNEDTVTFFKNFWPRVKGEKTSKCFHFHLDLFCSAKYKFQCVYCMYGPFRVICACVGCMDQRLADNPLICHFDS